MTRTDGVAESVVGSVVGNYQIIKKLGEGGMGTVYLAQHTLLGRRAALKMLLPMLSARPDVVNRFFNEARAATSISDPGIVQIFDFGYHTDGSAFIVMEFLEGEPLDRRLQSLGRMPVVDALRLTRQVATSLAAAHAQNIVHRDLKPENIYLVRDAEVASGERPKLLDFGIAKLSDEHPGKMKTQAGALMGTPTYMSPEQCRGASELDHRSDIYALGCVLFHLVAGRPPFDGEGLGEILAAHLREPAPALSSRVPGIAPNVDAIVARCLAKRPDERFQSMHELAAAIGAVLPHTTNPGGLAPGYAAYAGGPTPPPGSPTGPGPGTPYPSWHPAPSSSQAGPAQGATPTTLGSSAGQVARPARSARWILPVLAIVVLGGGGLVTAIALRGDGASSPAAVGAPDPAAPPPGTIATTGAPTTPSPPPPPPTAPAPAPAPALDAGITAAALVDAALPAVATAAPAPAPPAATAAPALPTAPAKRRPRTPKPTPSNSAGPADGCDRRIDVDCDGIPDVR
jgi:serine/threonine-protein kinase